jgi:NADH-quinone oxidoreductase subunit J
VLLTAHLIAVIQILVYAGAIMVLFLFVIMLLALSDQQLGFSKLRVVQVLGGVGAAGMAFLVVWAIRGLGWMEMPALQRDDMGIVSFGTVKLVGEFLFTQYLLPFEATSVLLLVAIVGAVVVAKEKI